MSGVSVRRLSAVGLDSIAALSDVRKTTQGTQARLVGWGGDDSRATFLPLVEYLRPAEPNATGARLLSRGKLRLRRLHARTCFRRNAALNL